MPDSTRTAELLWDTGDRARRGPKPSLTLGRIVEVAIAKADAEGIATLSMQRIADELGYTKMSLYRYVPGRAELLALMLDTALGAPPELATVNGGWRPRLHAWALAWRDVANAHPWALETAVGARVYGPNELGWLEVALGALAETNLTGGERLDAIVLVNGHVRSLVQQTAPAGTSEKDTGALMAGILTDRADRYPQVAAAFAAAGANDEQDNALEFGLERIFDGLAALIQNRARVLPRQG
ncbi:TetR/AcrR family transcriptional regulator C-terminal domain-containing protein [Antrihabitans stalactiti]|uniref:TetR/AcrR family transcriptional regulator n=1 Tax=Antrihabitans stalactiti TaxID=2584121 RepID=A0A848KJX5_9NOCA|nr:TetR/AcrR family transcriptional regulator [Antrihabitans stalactiti]